MGQLAAAAATIRDAQRPLLIAGGGVHYSGAEAVLTAFAERCNIPVVETVAGKACLLARHPLNAGPVGATVANYLGGYGVRTLLIDRSTEVVDYPRAVGMDDECLRSFQGVGLADRMLADRRRGGRCGNSVRSWEANSLWR